MRRFRLIVDAQVSCADVLEGVDEEEMERAAWLASYTDTSVRADATLAEQAVTGLLGGELEQGDADCWAEPYAEVFAALGLALEPWRDRLERLRIWNAPGFCRVWDADSSRSGSWSLDDDEYVSAGRRPEPVDAGSIYTLPVDVAVELVSNALTVTPKAVQAAPALRPALGSHPALRGLAEHLRPRVEATFGGERRLAQGAVLAPICAAVATVDAVMRRTARYLRRGRIYRPEVLDACLTALDLGPHREALERIVLRDHPDHLHVDTSALPAAMVRSEWRDALGVFARNPKGELVDVSRAARQQLLPRVLFSLSGAEPF